MPKRNKFSRSHYNILTGNFGELLPIYWDEVLPGDIWQQSSSLLIRLSPLVKPPLHPVQVRVHTYYCPIRLLWEDHEDYFTGGQDGKQVPVHPHFQPGTTVEGDLCDYLGWPPHAYGTRKFNVLPIRAYQKIWMEHYRDQDLISEPVISESSGLDSTTEQDIRRVAWAKDKFTTCRTETQRGDDIGIPLGTDANVISNGTGIPTFNVPSSSPSPLNAVVGSQNVGWSAAQGTTQTASWNTPNLKADLTSATGVLIDDLRLALGKQRYMEIMQRAGARYGEYARAIFGVTNPDSRLIIPEYLGGGRSTISFSEILSTSEAGTQKVGDLAGHGISAMKTRKYRRFFTEHGIVMSLLSVVPKTIYTQQLDVENLRDENTIKEDYFMPQLQGIGDTEVYNEELKMDHATPDGVFGYNERYGEYRSKTSRVCAEMRSTPGYDWHFGRVFGSDPALNQSFIECNPSKRSFADQTVDSMQIQCYHSIQARRPIGASGLPTRI